MEPEEPKIFQLLYLASPARPIGLFSFSGGMESLTQRGVVRDAESLYECLWGLARHGFAKCELPLLRRCFESALAGDREGLLYWNDVSFALRETGELFLEEAEPGRALCRLLREQGLAPDFFRGGAEAIGYTAALGLAAAALGLGAGDLRALLSAFLWSLAEGLATAAAKSAPLGQKACQSALLRLAGRMPALVEDSLKTPDSAIGASLPFRAVLSALHEESPLRMFRS
jgi:urease accessory protein